jgi:hypothetical protein
MNWVEFFWTSEDRWYSINYVCLQFIWLKKIGGFEFGGTFLLIVEQKYTNKEGNRISAITIRIIGKECNIGKILGSYLTKWLCVKIINTKT